MNIMIIHGYLLSGTGSNLYVSNLCSEFCRQGHDVSVVCQENKPEDFDYITEIVDFSDDNKKQTSKQTGNSINPGKCILYRPNLGGFLPVYVYDEYEGFEVKEFTVTSEAQIEQYNERNQQALETIFKKDNQELIISNHTIMQPVYASRAFKDTGQGHHFTVVHGSCLNFSVRKSVLLKKYALESIRGSDKIIFVSSHSKDEFMTFFDNDPQIGRKAIINWAGVNIEKFQPLHSSNEKIERVGKLIDKNRNRVLDSKGRTKMDKQGFRNKFTLLKEASELKQAIDDLNESVDNWTPDADVAENLSNIRWNEDSMVLYYGKYLWTKGIQLLITTAPLVLQEHPETKFIIVGFGSYRGYLESLVSALDTGNKDIFKLLLTQESFFTDEKESTSSIFFKALLSRLEEDDDFSEKYFQISKNNLSDRIIFTGVMNHEELKDLIPVSNITIATSIFPEAFGMVAVEALASGILPMQTNHTGFRDVIRVYIEAFQDIFDKKRLQALRLDESLIFNLANNIKVFLHFYKKMNEEELNTIRKRSRSVAETYYSWTTVANNFIQLARK